MSVIQYENFDNANAVLGVNIQEADTIWSNVDNHDAEYAAALEGSGFSALFGDDGGTGACRNSPTDEANQVIRIVLRFAALPTADCVIANLYETDLLSNKVGDLMVTTTGKLRVRDLNTQALISTMSLAINTTYAIEWKFDLTGLVTGLRIYSSLSQFATATETVADVAVTHTLATTIGQVQIGKMTGTTFKPQIDSYKRCDDWWAGIPADTWNEEFTGTVGSTIVTNANISQITGTAPVVGAGGINIDQKRASFTEQSTSRRSLRCVQFEATDLDNFERFYFTMPVEPDLANADPLINSDRMRIWLQHTGAGLSGMSLVVVGTGAGTYDLELWDETFGTSGAAAVAVVHGLVPGQTTRVEVETDLNVTPEHHEVTVNVWKGKKVHSTKASKRLGTMTGRSNNNAWRFRSIGQIAWANGNHNPAITFDGWVGNPGANPGPIDPSVRFDPPPTNQWQFSKVVAGVETPLILEGWVDYSDDPDVVRPLNIGATELGPPDAPPPSGRFSGDPGVGKVYLGWDTSGSFTFHEGETAKLRAVNPANGYAPMPTLAEGIFRMFTLLNDTPTGSSTTNWGLHSDGSWTELRQGAANTDIVHISCGIETNNTDPAGTDQRLDRYLSGYFNPWLDKMAIGITDAYERYGTVTYINHENEPDAWGNSQQSRNLTRMRKLRGCHRYTYFYLLSKGVPREAFEVVSPTTFQQTSFQSKTRFNHTPKSVDGANPSGDANRLDHLAFWDPDWKAQYTTAGGHWNTFLNPNPVDFLSGSQMDEWGFGPGRICRVWSCNTYFEKDASYFGATQAFFNQRGAFSYNADTWGSHHGNLIAFRRALYGEDFGIVIGELGYMAYQNNDATLTGDVAKSVLFAESLVADFAANNVIGVSKWRHDSGVWGANLSTPPVRYANKTGAEPQADPADTNRKMLSAMWQQPQVVLPHKTGTYGQPKPLSPQHG